MPTPTLAQARSQYERQRAVVAAAAVAIRRLFAQNPRPTIPQIASTAARYQLAAATVTSSDVAGYAGDAPETLAQAFLGVSSYGYSLTEPITVTIDRIVPAPAEAVPDPWWDDADWQKFLPEVERLVASEVADAARTATQVEIVARPEWQKYVRVLTPPSCGRCAILAGRIYRNVDAFQRHPLCDCVMVPVEDWESAHDAGLVSSVEAAFQGGHVQGLSRADAQAIADGADPATVVNATAGTSQPGITNAIRAEVFGHRVKATTYGTTKRAQWRKQNPTRLVRLRPEAIYEFAKDHEDALRLLRLYGYLTS